MSVMLANATYVKLFIDQTQRDARGTPEDARKMPISPLAEQTAARLPRKRRREPKECQRDVRGTLEGR